MLNKIPKTIEAWISKNEDKVHSYHLEIDGYSDNDKRPFSIWCYLHHEWINDRSETSCIHAATVIDFMEDARSIRMRTHEEWDI